MDRLRAQYGAGGLLHFGQGKWYPGEQLPRWSLNLLLAQATASRSGRDPALFADERDDYGATERDGRARSCDGWRRGSGVDRDARLRRPTRTPWYYLWRERQLPINVDPFDSRLADPLERERLRRVFERGLDAPVGYVLPIARRRAPAAAAGARAPGSCATSAAT